MKVQGKVIVVTGAGSGIGKALTLELLARGAKVAAVDLRTESLDELKELVVEHADSLSLHTADITNAQAVQELPKSVVKAHDQVDGIVNNAGIIQPFVRVNDLDYDAIDKVMQVNFYGTLYMVKAFLPILLKRREAHIVNVSSMGGFLPVPGQSVYGASKAAVKLLSEGLYAELKDSGIGVSIVFPGATETNITQNSGVEVPKLATGLKAPKYSATAATKVASIIVNGIEKGKVRICTGKDSKMMNALYRLSPGYATDLIAKQMKSLLPK